MFISIERIIRAGWVSLRRQSGLTIATIFTMVMTISLVTSLFLFQKITSFSIAQLQEKVDISIYFKQNSLEEDILQIKDEIAQLPEVKSVEYISDEEAKRKLAESHPELEDSLKETEGLLNLASLNVKAIEASQYAAISSFLETASFNELIEKVDYSERKPVIEKIFAITAGINNTGIALSLILAIVAFLVAFNEVKLTICNSREEIFIQRLVGASNWFIRGPFLVQGVIIGFFAALITLLIFTPLILLLSPRMETFFGGLNLSQFFFSHFFLIFFIQILTGISLGAVSSIIAIRKYLEA